MVEIIVASLALVVAYLTWSSQKTHNRLSVIPIPEIKYSDMISKVSVSLVNKGTGPLRILTLRVYAAGGKHFESVMDATHLDGARWYVGNIDGRAIEPSGRISLLQFQADPFSHRKDIHRLRRELGACEIVVQYTDVYGTSFPPYRRSLSWFARHDKPPVVIDSDVTD